MNTRAYSLSLPIATVLLFCALWASAQTPSATTAAATLDYSLVTIVPCADLRMTTPTVTLSPNGLVKVEGFKYDRYSVFDGQDEMWIAGPGTASQTIDLGHLPTGVYYLHLATKDGEIVSKLEKVNK